MDQCFEMLSTDRGQAKFSEILFIVDLIAYDIILTQSLLNQ